MCLGFLDPVSQQKFAISKIQDGGGSHFEKSKNHNIYAMDGPIQQNLAWGV